MAELILKEKKTPKWHVIIKCEAGHKTTMEFEYSMLSTDWLRRDDEIQVGLFGWLCPICKAPRDRN